MERLPLLPVDYVFSGSTSPPITFAFSYLRALDPELLAGGLRQLARDFFPLRSRLVRTTETDYEFKTADPPLAIELRTSGLAFDPDREITEYITPVRSVAGEPLTSIVLTQTPGGSVLALSISHALVDGFSYFHFLSSWARVCRGERFIPPSHERGTFLSQLDAVGEDIPPEKITERTGLFQGGRRKAADNVRTERFFLPDETIKGAMEEARRHHTQPLTENDVIAALLWRKYLPRWVSEAGSDPTYLTIPFDFRRAVAGFPKNYFGCALSFATASTESGSLRDSPAGDLASRVRSAVGRMRGEQILRSTSALEAFRKSRGLAALQELHLHHPFRGMIVTNLTRMPIADIDFGGGAPAGYSAHLEITCGAAILPGSGGVNIMVGHPSLESPDP